MHSLDRRKFLAAGVLTAASLGARTARARLRAVAPATVILDPARPAADLDRKLFGSFLEHIGRVIYGGVFEPGSPLADEQGFRRDVLAEIRALGVPIVRYPGGNFVSGYNWLDGVGPPEKRPRVLERAWNSIETNQFGTNEYVAWCRRVGAEPLLAVNLGTGTPETAAALVEYCNAPAGTRYSDLRQEHGVAEPHGVKYWCLGNEMDGPWQIGHTTAADYGRKAADAARQMRIVDRSVQLVACGSSGPFMPTYLEWDRQALEQCYRDVDAISLHRYLNNTTDTGGDSARFLALNLSVQQQIDDVYAVCEFVRARLRSTKKMWLSFDEWNVWYRDTQGDGKRQQAPRLIEEAYNLEDALVVGGILNTLMRRADKVRVACLAQLVNVIAPVVTNPEGLLRQSIFYPYSWALRYARGKTLDVAVESTGYEAPGIGAVPYLDVAATWDAPSGEGAVFLLNRDLEHEREATLVWRESPPRRVLACQTLTGDDLKAANTFDAPTRVAPQALEPPRLAARTTVKLPARSYTVLHLAWE